MPGDTGRKLNRLIGAVFGLALVLSASPAPAVIVELVSGQRIEGVLREASAARVQIDVGGQLVVFEAGDVRAIYFTPPFSPPVTPAETSPPSPQAAPAPEPRPADAAEVLGVLKALRAAVDAGMSAPEYPPRVSEARATVDRYLATVADTPPPGSEALSEAMHYYQIAEFAWRNHSVTSRTVWLQKDDALARCPSYVEFAVEMDARGESYYTERTRSFAADLRRRAHGALVLRRQPDRGSGQGLPESRALEGRDHQGWQEVGPARRALQEGPGARGLPGILRRCATTRCRSTA